MPRRFELEADTLEAARRKVTDEHGPDAKVVHAERITEGGIGGFFARQRFVLTVEVPDAAPAPRFDLSARAGIAALLADADDDDGLVTSAPVERPQVSTQAAGFDSLVEGLLAQDRGPAVPELRTGPGDLVAVVGMRTDATETAAAMIAHTGPALGAPEAPVTDRRTALAARADGVAHRRATVVAIDGPAADVITRLRAIGADQVWVAVDATRKPADVARWVAQVRAAVTVAAVAVIAAEETATPGTVDALGLPVGWSGSGPVPAAHQ